MDTGSGAGHMCPVCRRVRSVLCYACCQVSMCRLVAPALLLWPCPRGLPLSLSQHPSRISQQYRDLLQKTSLSFCCPSTSEASIPSKHSMALHCVHSTDLIAGPSSEGHAFLIPWQRIGQSGFGWGRNMFAPASPALVLGSHSMQMHPSPPLLLRPGSQPHLFGHEPIPYSEADRWRLSLN